MLGGYAAAAAGPAATKVGTLENTPDRVDVGQAAFISPDGKRVFTGNEQLSIWDAQSATRIKQLGKHPSDKPGVAALVNDGAWSPDGTRFVTIASRDHSARIWDGTTGKLVVALTGHTRDPLTVAWSPDGSRLATGGEDLTLRIWDARTGKQQTSIAYSNDPVGGISMLNFSRDGKRLVVVGDPTMNQNGDPLASGTAIVCDVVTGKVIVKVSDPPVTWAELSPDGKRLLLGTKKAGAQNKIWDASTGKELVTLQTPAGSEGGALTFSRDGARILRSGNLPPQLLDATTGKVVATLGTTPSDAYFSPDGARVATTGRGSVQVWDVKSGKSIVTFSTTATIVRMSADGRLLLAYDDDNSNATIWKLP